MFCSILFRTYTRLEYKGKWLIHHARKRTWFDERVPEPSKHTQREKTCDRSVWSLALTYIATLKLFGFRCYCFLIYLFWRLHTQHVLAQFSKKNNGNSSLGVHQFSTVYWASIIAKYTPKCVGFCFFLKCRAYIVGWNHTMLWFARTCMLWFAYSTIFGGGV